jgi:hypothetical protein
MWKEAAMACFKVLVSIILEELKRTTKDLFVRIVSLWTGELSGDDSDAVYALHILGRNFEADYTKRPI